MKRRFVAALLLLAATSAPALALDPSTWGPVTAYSNPIALAPPPASIAGSGTLPSVCIASTYARAFDVFAAVAGAATLQVQRYADAAVNGVGGCTQPVGAAQPATAQALTQGGGCPGSTYCGDVGNNDGLPWAALKVTLTDTSGSTNAITSVILTQGAE